MKRKNLHLHVHVCSSGSGNDLQSVTQDNNHPTVLKHAGIWLVASSCLISPLKNSLSPSAVFLENVETGVTILNLQFRPEKLAQFPLSHMSTLFPVFDTCAVLRQTLCKVNFQQQSNGQGCQPTVKFTCTITGFTVLHQTACLAYNLAILTKIQGVFCCGEAVFDC